MASSKIETYVTTLAGSVMYYSSYGRMGHQRLTSLGTYLRTLRKSQNVPFNTESTYKISVRILRVCTSNAQSPYRYCKRRVRAIKAPQTKPKKPVSKVSIRRWLPRSWSLTVILNMPRDLTPSFPLRANLVNIKHLRVLRS